MSWMSAPGDIGEGCADYRLDPDYNFWTDWIFGTGGCENTVGDRVGDLIGDSVMKPFVDDMRAGVGDAIKSMATFWLSVPDPDVGNPATGERSEVVEFLSSSVAPIAATILVMAVMVGALKMMWDARAAGEHFKGIVALVIRYVMVSALVVPVVGMALVAARAFSSWIIERSTDGTSFVDNLFALFDSNQGVASAIVLFVVLLFAAIMSGLQSLIMIWRGAILLILTGVFLLAVSYSNTDDGKQTYKTTLGWIIGWILYGPAAAIVYGAGFRLLGTDTTADGNGLTQCLYGLALIMMAIFTLPAILRLVVPATAPVATGGGAGAVVVGAAATAVPMAMSRK
jgi:type IV secretion system protein TrbL